MHAERVAAKNIYETMFRIRAAEEAIIKHYPEDDMKTPMHMSIGEEAIVTGVCEALSERDYLLGTYRSHALYIARTKETDRFFAELYGKEAGTGKGKAGSMHLAQPDMGLLYCSAIVGGTISIASGVALASKMRGDRKVVTVFFGDGASDSGTFWESINYASLEQIPVLFVHEDNDLAVHTRKKSRQGHKGLENVLANFDIDVYNGDGCSVFGIYEMTRIIIQKIRETSRPAFLTTKYFRFLEHVGISSDLSENYRAEDKSDWQDKDPVKVARRELLLRNDIFEDEVLKLEQRIESQVTQSIERAKSSPPLNPAEVVSDVFV